MTLALSRRLKTGGSLVYIDADKTSGWGAAILARISEKKDEDLSSIIAHRGGIRLFLSPYMASD